MIGQIGFALADLGYKLPRENIDMKNGAVYLAGLLGAALWLLTGCSEDEPQVDSNEPTASQNRVTNNAPASLSGKSYTFTVTGSQNFTEPFNSDYTIDFTTETTYILHPLGRNNQPTADRQGNYSYETRSGLIHFAETSPDSGRTFEAVLSFSAAEAGTAHLTGRNGESQDALFFQTAP